MPSARTATSILWLLLVSACAAGTEPASGAVRVRERDGMARILVPQGEFLMGSTLEMSRDAKTMCEETKGHSARAACRAAAFNDERPAHRVGLDAFWLDRTEVTNGQYGRCVQAGACEPPLLSTSSSRASYFGEPAYAVYPVLNVRWDMAAEYCTWAGARLPTEAEWEYAARGPKNLVFPWGNEFDGLRLNYCDSNCPLLSDPSHDDGYADTSPVGAFASGASWIGALDMAGNVREWVADWLGPYRPDDATDPLGAQTGEYKVTRGGAWYDTPDDVRSTNRGGEMLDYWRDNLGFRCAQDPG